MLNFSVASSAALSNVVRTPSPLATRFACLLFAPFSVDLHKYGGSNKGCSVCVFASDELRAASYMPSFDGCEGLYVTPTLQGSRSGATMAASWGSVLHRGDDGYRKMARNHHNTLEKAKSIVASIDGLELLVEPEGAILPIVTSPSHPKLNIYTISGGGRG